MFNCFKSFLGLLISLSITLNVSAQEIPIGSWQDHFSYNNGNSVTYGNGEVYCASESALIAYNPSEKTVQRLSVINGLSDIEPSVIKYNSYNGKLIITYKNGNIDILDQNKNITNLGVIKNNSGIIGSKTVNHIYFNNQYAYLSTGFGIVVLNTDKDEVSDTYFFGPLGTSVYTNSVTFDQNNIYAATNDGVYFANRNSLNLADYNQWSKIGALGSKKYSNIVYFTNHLVVSMDSPNWESDYVFYDNGTSWQKLIPIGLNIKKLNVFNNKLLVAGSGVLIFDENLVQIENLYTFNSQFGLDVNDVYLDAENNYWIAENYNGLLKQKNNWEVSKISVNCPNTSTSFGIDFVDDNLWMVSGAYSQYRTYSPFNIRKKYDWQNVPTTLHNPENGALIYDVVSVAINPSNTNQVFAGSWYNGLLEFNNGTLSKVYNGQNSALDSVFYGITAVSGITFDYNNNLWVTSSYTTSILAVKTPDNNWFNFSFPGKTNAAGYYTKVMVDKNNFVWIIDPKNLKFLVFDYYQTIDNKTDDRVTNSVTFNSAEVITFVEDLDGEIWFGTSQGVGVMYNPINVFSGSEPILPVYIQQDGQTQLLLETERVNVIAIDGANRKWIGTQSSGVYLMSADGSEEIFHFTKNNSPLYSNTINDIKLNNKTGEVFIATDKGLISYKGTATEAQNDFSNVFVYPNPVREDYNGVIAIRGLVKDTDVRITDISGNVVSQTKSLGGQAIWDGKDLNGNRVQTGVYMVFNASQDGAMKQAAKILFIH